MFVLTFLRSINCCCVELWCCWCIGGGILSSVVLCSDLRMLEDVAVDVVWPALHETAKRSLYNNSAKRGCWKCLKIRALILSLSRYEAGWSVTHPRPQHPHSQRPHFFLRHSFTTFFVSRSPAPNHCGFQFTEVQWWARYYIMRMQKMLTVWLAEESSELWAESLARFHFSINTSGWLVSFQRVGVTLEVSKISAEKISVFLRFLWSSWGFWQGFEIFWDSH